MVRSALAAIQQMIATPDAPERLKIAASAIQEMGWKRVSVAIYDTILRVLTATRAGVILSRKEDPALWLVDHTQLTDDLRVGGAAYQLETEEGPYWVIPLRVSGGRLAGILKLEAPETPDLYTTEGLLPLELLAAQIIATLESSALQDALEASNRLLSHQVDELTVLQAVDEELNATLNLENVMMLAADWALRSTGSRAVIVAVTEPTVTGLIPLVTLGYPRSAMPYDADNPIPVTQGIIGRAVRTRELCVVPDVRSDPDYHPLLPGIRAQIAIPLISQGTLLGALALESDRRDGFDERDLEFVKRLGARASVALDNARLYREAEQRADEASALYSAGRSISSSLEREDILPRIARSLSDVCETTGAFVADLRMDRESMTILVSFRALLKEAVEEIPAVGETVDLRAMTNVLGALREHRAFIMRAGDPALAPYERNILEAWKVQSALVTLLSVGDETLGVAFVTESRIGKRLGNLDKVLLFETLASQAAVAIRQANLYDEVRELENLKSEMIRMASHDLRNPLGNVIGYIDLLSMTLKHAMTSEDQEYLFYMKKSALQIRSLIDDLLTLEKIESEREKPNIRIDLGVLTHEVYDAQKASAELKHHTLLFEYDGEPLYVMGNQTQLRQAITNLVGNAIKYTREQGRIVIRLRPGDRRVDFEVEDNGFGIAPERQKRLFQRFYRAKQPGTEEIPGTGLGLSMVKTVIERHGGQVWVRSVENVGSTFGMWLPDAASTEILSAGAIQNQEATLDEG